MEVWGDIPDRMSGGRYKATRAFKERWQANNPNFVGIQYQDCLSDARLTKILESHIGVIEPFQFEKPSDRLIETSHWSDADELLASCGELAAQMPNGIFPSEGWLRKRGKYVNRSGPSYNTLAVRVNQWLGGSRAVRELLGHGHASTTAWTAERAITAWREFHKKHGLTPSQCQGPTIRRSLAKEVLAEASKIYSATWILGVLTTAREGRNERKIVWTPERAITAWRDFQLKHGRTPSQCMSSKQRQTLPREVTDKATRIYNAAQRLGVLAAARAFPLSQKSLSPLSLSGWTA